MGTKKWIARMVDGEFKLIPIENYAPSAKVYVQQDTMEPIRSMADGKMYDSKSAYRRDVKARGLIELGNETIKEPKRDIPEGLRNDIREAYERITGR